MAVILAADIGVAVIGLIGVLVGTVLSAGVQLAVVILQRRHELADRTAAKKVELYQEWLSLLDHIPLDMDEAARSDEPTTGLRQIERKVATLRSALRLHGGDVVRQRVDSSRARSTSTSLRLMLYRQGRDTQRGRDECGSRLWLPRSLRSPTAWRTRCTRGEGKRLMPFGEEDPDEPDRRHMALGRIAASGAILEQFVADVLIQILSRDTLNRSDEEIGTRKGELLVTGESISWLIDTGCAGRASPNGALNRARGRPWTLTTPALA
jgi:hypothetical protein